MKWFDTEEIKDKKQLSAREIEYLKGASVSVLGPFNVLIRRHWDLLLALLGVNILAEFISEDYFVGLLLLLVGYGWLLYFSIRHGRRLAWNRNKWESFSAFQRSEDRWIPWGWVVAILLIGTFWIGFSEGWNGY